MFLSKRLFFNKSLTSLFRYNDLNINVTNEPKSRDFDNRSLVFGKHFTDHMLICNWYQDKGWEKPRIIPYQPLKVDPGIKALHYAVQLFDGMKAFIGYDEKIRLFRPELNIQRILKGTHRLALPPFEPEELLKCIKTLVEIDKLWIPKPDPNSLLNSLYIRPTYLGTEPTLGVMPSNSAMIYVIMSPVSSYYSNSTEHISLYADPNYTRSWPNGVGDIKLGSNYAPTVYVQKVALEKGCQQVLWLHGDNHTVTEVGAMNVFMLWENSNKELELITPPLNGLILPGITRRSILELTRSWNEFIVTEKEFTMGDIIKGIKENRVKEFFGTGTAVCVTPVDSILFKKVTYDIPTVKQERPLYKRLLHALNDIYTGRVESKWTTQIETIPEKSAHSHDLIFY